MTDHHFEITGLPGAGLTNPDDYRDLTVSAPTMAATPADLSASPAPAELPIGYIPLPQGLHPDTAKLVCAFAEATAAKLRLSEIKYGWTANWMRPDWRDELAAELQRHVHKGDPRDVAAYCAFAWHHGWSIAPPSLPAQAVQGEALTVLQWLLEQWEGDGWVTNQEATAARVRDVLAGKESATPPAGEGQEDAHPYKEALHQLVSLRAEQYALSGGGPGISERLAKAWAEAEELVRVEE